jgi:hypothetical protein
MSLQPLRELREALHSTLRKIEQNPYEETSPALIELKRIVLQRIAVLDAALNKGACSSDQEP